MHILGYSMQKNKHPSKNKITHPKMHSVRGNGLLRQNVYKLHTKMCMLGRESHWNADEFMGGLFEKVNKSQTYMEMWRKGVGERN